MLVEEMGWVLRDGGSRDSVHPLTEDGEAIGEKGLRMGSRFQGPSQSKGLWELQKERLRGSRRGSWSSERQLAPGIQWGSRQRKGREGNGKGRPKGERAEGACGTPAFRVKELEGARRKECGGQAREHF